MHRKPKNHWQVLTVFLLLMPGCGPSQEQADTEEGLGKVVSGLSPNGEIRVLRDGEVVRTVPAEYVPLDYPEMPWRGDPGIGASQDGTLYVALYHRIFYSNDDGRSWDFHPIPAEILKPPQSSWDAARTRQPEYRGEAGAARRL